MSSYNHKKVERKWQSRWAREGTHEPDLDKPKLPFYNLMMFPYPSAEGLHAGNMYAFTGSDIYGRFKRMQGNDVLEPIGLDGFGIHSENYALKIGTHPLKQSKISEKRFYKQLESLGNGFAWNSKVETYDPEYYKWTQWIFIQLFKRGLAYKKKASVNWCPKDLTVLADEQVIAGECERCGTRVVKKDLEQWFFKITDYANKLLTNLEKLDWSEKVKVAQRNWIGRSEGAEISFQLISRINADKNQQISADKNQSESTISGEVKVFTTRPDTIFGATYLVISPEHEILEKLQGNNEYGIKNGSTGSPQVENAKELKKYIKQAKKKTEIERTAEGKVKTGIELKGIKAVNPATKEEIPVWVADYVLPQYGTGAVMAVPAHDERDWDFAKKYNLPVKRVIDPIYVNTTDEMGIKTDQPIIERNSIMAVVKHWSEDKYLGLKWKKVNWQTLITGAPEEGETPTQGAISEIIQETGYLHPKFIKNLSPVHSKFFHIPKRINRFAHFTTFYFELQDDERKKVSEVERHNHEAVWLTRNEMENFLTPKAHQYVWRSYTGEQSAYEGEGILCDSVKFSGLSSEVAKKKITEFVGGEWKTTYRLRDWLISRQRYWGPPIPLVFCEDCAEWHPVPEDDLPVLLPKVKDFRPTGKGHSPLAEVKSFINTKCPACGGKARRETDVSDTFLDSAWYFFAYLSRENHKLQVTNHKSRFKHWLPVDMYIGGAEHSVLHLLYTRFITMVFRDMGLVEFDEPFKKFRAHGLIIKGGAKMSKSKGNIVNPDDYITRFGADVLRTYLMFLSPFEQGGDFRDEGIAGIVRFLEILWKFASKRQGPTLMKQANQGPTLTISLHKTIKKVTEDIENLHYNTAISALMILLNAMEKEEAMSREVLEIFIKMLNPFAPHLCHEIWETLGNKTILDTETWPEFDEMKLIQETATMAVQVNGKTRATVVVQRGVSEAEVKEIALSDITVSKWVGEKSIKRTIYVKDRLINFLT